VNEGLNVILIDAKGVTKLVLVPEIFFVFGCDLRHCGERLPGNLEHLLAIRRPLENGPVLRKCMGIPAAGSVQNITDA